MKKIINGKEYELVKADGERICDLCIFHPDKCVIKTHTECLSANNYLKVWKEVKNADKE